MRPACRSAWTCGSMRGVPSLSAGACQVWWATLGQLREWHDRLLSRAEVDRRSWLVRAADRDRFTLGVALSRAVLAGQLGVRPDELVVDRTCQRCGRAHGKPQLVRPRADLRFSVSHSGSCVVAAVTKGAAVGVDIEQCAKPKYARALADFALSTAERSELDRRHRRGRADAFLRYWARKEAILKATGEGLTTSPLALTVSAPQERPRLVYWEGRPLLPARLTLNDLGRCGGYVASVAVLDHPTVTVTELDASPALAAGHGRHRDGPFALGEVARVGD